MFGKKGDKKIGESLGISGFTLSILGIILVGTTGIVLSIISFIFCYIQQRRNPNKIGKAGLIISIIGFVINVAIIITYILYLAPMLNQLI